MKMHFFLDKIIYQQKTASPVPKQRTSTSTDDWDIVDPKDWFMSRSGNMKRSQILALVYVAKDIIRSPDGKIFKADYEEAMRNAENTGFDRAKSLKVLSWEKLRVAIRNIRKKYEGDAVGFSRFLDLARAMWRQDTFSH